MKNVSLSYSQFKSVVAAKSLLAQYVEGVDRYDLFAIEGQVSWETSFLKDGGSDVTDFEANFKSTYNLPMEYRSTDGLLKVASAKFADSKSFWVDGTATQADLSAGQTKYVKKHFATDFTLAGVDARWDSSCWGDYIDFEVGFYTDENDEATFNSVMKFADHYMIYGTASRLFDVPTVKTVPTTVTIGQNTYNMYIRAKCVNAGATASKVIINLVGWK